MVRIDGCFLRLASLSLWKLMATVIFPKSLSVCLPEVIGSVAGGLVSIISTSIAVISNSIERLCRSQIVSNNLSHRVGLHFVLGYLLSRRASSTVCSCVEGWLRFWIFFFVYPSLSVDRYSVLDTLFVNPRILRSNVDNYIWFYEAWQKLWLSFVGYLVYSKCH